MRIFLTGATGLIGRMLCDKLKQAGHETIALSRNLPKSCNQDGVKWVQGNCMKAGHWQNYVDASDAVIHLAGESVVNRRWSSPQKELIYKSRIESTKRIVEAIRAASKRPRLLICPSADGFYGSRGEEGLDERSGPGDDFLARVCRDWEAECSTAKDLGVRPVYLRFGTVLSPRGGALPRLTLLTKFFLGGSIGHQQRWFPWIHEEDAVGLILFALSKTIEGPINAVSPGLVRMQEFVESLAAALRRPAFSFIPAWLLRLMVGELALYLSHSQKIYPRAAIDSGYKFHHHSVHTAIWSCLGIPRSARPSDLGEINPSSVKSFPSHVYYFKCGIGKWGGKFHFRITDKVKFLRQKPGVITRIIVLLTHLLDKVIGSCSITSQIEEVFRDTRTVSIARNNILMRRFGVTIYRQVIDYCLEEDGINVTVVGWERHGPIPGLFTHPVEHWGRVAPDGHNNEYRIPMLGDNWVGLYRISENGKELSSNVQCPWAKAGENLEKIEG